MDVHMSVCSQHLIGYPVFRSGAIECITRMVVIFHVRVMAFDVITKPFHRVALDIEDKATVLVAAVIQQGCGFTVIKLFRADIIIHRSPGRYDSGRAILSVDVITVETDINRFFLVQ